jgi:hypothetical protein
MFPDYWKAFATEHRLARKTACIDEDDDASGLGADLLFLTEAQSDDELANCWPGLGVGKDGYVPVAACATGSGDYYYIDSREGAGGALYRIYHDAVGPEGYDPDEAIELVLEHHADVLRHLGS